MLLMFHLIPDTEEMGEENYKKNRYGQRAILSL